MPHILSARDTFISHRTSANLWHAVKVFLRATDSVCNRVTLRMQSGRLAPARHWEHTGVPDLKCTPLGPYRRPMPRVLGGS